MFIEELRRQTYTGVDAFVVVVLQRTVLIGITHGYTVWHIFQSSGHGEVMIRAKCYAIDFFLPVYIRIAQLESFWRIAMLCKGFTEFFSRKHIHMLIYIAHRHISVVVERRACGAVACTFLGSDDDDTVGCTRTVNSRSRSILQHCKRSDIIRIDGTDRSIAHRHTVNNNQRVIIC